MNNSAILKTQPESVEAFREYATRTAFSVSLSKGQIKALRDLRVHQYTLNKIGTFERHHNVPYGKVKALQGRGLVDNEHRLTFIGMRLLEIIDLCDINT